MSELLRCCSGYAIVPDHRAALRSWVMFAHHLATIGLVLISYYCNYVRYGAMVLWLHDISDIPVDLLKLLNYLKLGDPPGLYLTEICFAANLISWVYFRLYVFPFKVRLSNTFAIQRYHLVAVVTGDLGRDSAVGRSTAVPTILHSKWYGCLCPRAESHAH